MLGKIGCSGNGVLFSTPAHLHAHVFGFHNNHNPQRIQRLLNTLFYLESHTFLHLQAVRENIHYAGYLAQSGNVAVRNICHMCLSVEGKCDVRKARRNQCLSQSPSDCILLETLNGVPRAGPYDTLSSTTTWPSPPVQVSSANLHVRHLHPTE